MDVTVGVSIRAIVVATALRRRVAQRNNTPERLDTSEGGYNLYEINSRGALLRTGTTRGVRFHRSKLRSNSR